MKFKSISSQFVSDHTLPCIQYHRTKFKGSMKIIKFSRFWTETLVTLTVLSRAVRGKENNCQILLDLS